MIFVWANSFSLDMGSTGEVSAVLGVSEKAVAMRHLRALDRLRRLLGD